MAATSGIKMAQVAPEAGVEHSLRSRTSCFWSEKMQVKMVSIRNQSNIAQKSSLQHKL
jgi:hypothetical protein